MFDIQIIDKYKKLSEKNFDLIKKTSNLIFENEEINQDLIFEIHIITNEESQEINKKYRDKDYPTDVISFALWDNCEFKTNLLGEIYLNYDKVIEQSKIYGHSFEREFVFLISHGIYHLLGYNHEDEKEEKVMLDKQYLILRLMGLGNINDK